MMKIQKLDISLFEQHLIGQGSLSESSIYTYVKSIEKFYLYNPNLEDIEDYNDFLINHTIKKRSVHYYSAIKKFVEFKIKDSNLKNNLFSNFVKPKIHKDIISEKKHLDDTMILKVINLLSHKHRVIALIQNLTGVRVGDILLLKRPNIVPEVYKDNPVLRLNLIGKGRKRNVIYIHDRVAQRYIADYIYYNFNHDEYYFIELGKMKNREGDLNNTFKLKKMNYEWYWYDLKKALQTIGINKNDFASHDFRRCYAREVWTKYKDIYMLQKLLNHADPKTTIRYLEQSGLNNIDYHYQIQMGK